MKKLVRGLLVLSVALAACGSDGGDGGNDGEGETHTLTGNLVIDQEFQGGINIFKPEETADKPCTSFDFGSQTTITIKDAQGTTIATGHPSSDEGKSTFEEATGVNCAIPFAVDNVPDSDFYSISVYGASEELSKSKSDLESACGCFILSCDQGRISGVVGAGTLSPSATAVPCAAPPHDPRPVYPGMRQRLSAVPATAKLHLLERLGLSDSGFRPLAINSVGPDELIEHPAMGSTRAWHPVKV